MLLIVERHASPDGQASLPLVHGIFEDNDEEDGPERDHYWHVKIYRVQVAGRASCSLEFFGITSREAVAQTPPIV